LLIVVVAYDGASASQYFYLAFSQVSSPLALCLPPTRFESPQNVHSGADWDGLLSNGNNSYLGPCIDFRGDSVC
jgi:hypothetical protein